MLGVHEIRFLVLLVSILIIYKIIRAYERRRLQKKWNTSSVQEKSFMQGLQNLFATFEARRSGRGPEYGKEKLKGSNTISHFLFGKKTFETRDADNIKEVLVAQSENFGIGRRQQVLYPIIGVGIFASEGQHWSFSRSILKPQFKRDQIMKVQYLESHIQNLFEHIRSQGSKPFDIQKLFYKLTLDISTEFLFGESLGTLCKDMKRNEFTNDAQEKEFEAAFNLSQRYMSKRLSLQRFYFLVDSKEFRRANEKVKEYAKFYVNKFLNLVPEELEANSQGHYMFLNELSKEYRSRKFLEDEALSLMLAGRSTTASLLSFVMFELEMNQRVWEKIKEEVSNAFGKGEESRLHEMNFESMKRCKYLQWIMNEALRLYPPVPLNMRVARKHTKLPKGGGTSQEDPILVEKGDTIFLSIYSCHRSKEYYGNDADMFIPERWEHLKFIGRRFLPFGAGPRMCLGQHLALTETSYAIIRIAQSFLYLTSQSEDYPPKLNSAITMSLMDGCTISLY